MSIISVDELAPTPSRHDRSRDDRSCHDAGIAPQSRGSRMSLFGRPVDATLAALLEDAGRNVERSALLLRELLAAFPEHAKLAQDLPACEREGDRITHDIIYRMGGGRRVRAPFDAGDGYALATEIDHVVDYKERRRGRLHRAGGGPARPLRGRGADGAGRRVRRCARSGGRRDPWGPALPAPGRRSEFAPGRDPPP